MAIMKLGNAFQAVSGRSGNAVYRSTKNGTEFAVRPFVNNPQTPAQNDVRDAFSKVTKQWKSLTPAQVKLWNDYADARVETERITGSRTTRSGFNWFVAYGVRYLLVNPSQTAAPASPPTSDYAGDPITISAEPSEQAGGGIVFSASAANGANSTTALLVQRLRNANSKPGKQYRTIAHFKFVSGTLQTTVPLSPGYYAVGTQFVNTATGEETRFESLGIVGPVSLAVAGHATSSKKKAA